MPLNITTSTPQSINTSTATSNLTSVAIDSFLSENSYIQYDILSKQGNQKIFSTLEYDNFKLLTDTLLPNDKIIYESIIINPENDFKKYIVGVNYEGFNDISNINGVFNTQYSFYNKEIGSNNYC